MEHKLPADMPFKSEDFNHVGVIVKDMDKTIDYLESIGIGPFGMMDGKRWVEVTFKGELHGKPAEWKVKISTGKVGPTEIELLQPSGGPSVLQEFLDDVGEGVHHIAYLVDDVRAEMDKMIKKGMEILTSANLDARGFAYARTAAGGIVVEIRKR